jgi:hypothetical protein
MACRSCGKRVIERGASPYIGKRAILHNGDEYIINLVDPDNQRRFGSNLNDGIFWFMLSDIKGLRG